MQVKFRFFVTVLLKGVFFLHVPSAYCDPDSSPPEESYWLAQVLSYSSRLPFSRLLGLQNFRFAMVSVCALTRICALTRRNFLVQKSMRALQCVFFTLPWLLRWLLFFRVRLKGFGVGSTWPSRLFWMMAKTVGIVSNRVSDN